MWEKEKVKWKIKPKRFLICDLWWRRRLIWFWGRRMSSRWIFFKILSWIYTVFLDFLRSWVKKKSSGFAFAEMWLPLMTFWHFAAGLRVHGESWHDYKPSKHCHQHLLLLIIMILIINVISLAISRTRNQLNGATSIIHKSDNTPTTTTTTTTYPPLHHHLHLIVTISCRSALSGRVESSTEISPTT